MTATDFVNSYMTWFPADPGGNIARIQLDAACMVVNERTGESETFYLIAPCRSERMYLDTQLFQMPNYEFCGIWAAEEFLILRTAWVSERDNREWGRNRERWHEVRLDIRTFPNVELLADNAAVLQATLENRSLLARTEVRSPDGGTRALLEYPVKTMNVRREPARFQVDTGPVILPDFIASTERAIERLEVGHVVYNEFNKAEFVLRRPVGVGPNGGPIVQTTDYSEIRVLPAVNTLLAVGG